MLAVTVSCGNSSKHLSSNTRNFGDAQQTKQAPAALTEITVQSIKTTKYQKKIVRKFPTKLKPVCLANTSSVIPTLLGDNFMGIRYLKPEGIFNEPYDQGGLALQEGWAVTVYDNLAGTEFPDYTQLEAETSIQTIPNFDGNIAPGGATQNFALLSETAFDMPIGRSIEFRVSARGTSRLTIDDEIVFTTPVVAQNAAPQAATFTVDLESGNHVAKIELKHAGGNPIFNLEMRFTGEADFRPLEYSGATPFKVFIEEDTGDQSDPEKFDEEQTRLAQWPSVSGTENIISCTRSVADGNIREFGERSLMDPVQIVDIQEISTTAYVAPLAVSSIKSLWAAPREMTKNPLKAVAFGDGTLGISLADGNIFSFELQQFLEAGEHKDVRSKLLGAFATENQTAVLLHVSSNLGSWLLSLFYDAANGELQGSLRLPPPTWESFPKIVGIAGKFALVTVEGQIYGVAIDGTSSTKINSPISGPATINGNNLLQISENGELIKLSVDSLIATLDKITTAETSPLLEAETISAGSLVTDIDSVFLDPFSQIWLLNDGRLEVLNPEKANLAFYSPNNGQLYLSDIANITEVEVMAEGKLIEKFKPTKQIALRSAKSNASKASWFEVIITQKDGIKITANLSRRAITGKVENSGGYNGGEIKGPIVKNPTNPTGPTGPSLSYAMTLAPIIQQSCLRGCHDGNNPSGGLPLETKDQVQEKFGSVLGSVGPAGGMPQNRTRWTPAQIKVLTDWRDGGYAD